MDEHNAYPVLEHDLPTHVSSNAITSFLGVVLALLLCAGLVSTGHALSWHPVVAGILTGLSGAAMGAFGSSTRNANLAGILGVAGFVNFILGLAMFTGLAKGIVG